MHRFALALVLAMSAAGPTAADDAAKAPAPEDRYLWLEDVTGEKALDWARARNAESAKVARRPDDFAALEKRILDILDSDARIPYVEKLGPWYYNFWRDAKNPRGLWRRTTLAEYRKAQPAWETVLDLDALGAAEKENWVWHGADCLKPEYKRCLVSLSRGGADADVVREFDLETKAFVKDGFSCPRPRARSAGCDARHALRRHRLRPGLADRPPATRGSPRSGSAARRSPQAETVFEGKPDDVAVVALPRPHARASSATSSTRGIDVLHRTRSSCAADGKLVKIEKPDSAERQRPPRPAAPRAARRLDGRRQDLPRGRAARRRLRGAS